MAAGCLWLLKAKSTSLFLNISFLFLLISLSTTHLLSSSNDHHSNCFLIKTPINPITKFSQILMLHTNSDIGCTELHQYPDNPAKCSYIKSHIGCKSGGYISYLKLFYCTFTPHPFFGYTCLLLCLVLLFYLLGDTAANYFCCSLDGLSKILNLSPAIAGVTLLSLGNGAPDLFASMASFMGDSSSTEQVGLNSILGGAFFVSTSVVGVISLCIDQHGRNPGHPSTRIPATVDKSSFVRDVLFLLLSLLFLLVIIMFGRINLWGAISFLSLYFLYVLIVSASEYFCDRKKRSGAQPIINGILPIINSCELESPLLGKRGVVENVEKTSISWEKIVGCLELPLYLPRRLTIPVISVEKWSKSYGVISVTVSPVFLAIIWVSHGNYGDGTKVMMYLASCLVGIIFGILAFFTTEKSIPPKKSLLPWLLGGFLMSITWTYILAQELVSLLVSMGLILGISPFILGLTVLAWGNSLGDLVANVAMARNGGPDGVQVAISGCYAGPIFNAVVGLGLSLAVASWAVYPSSYVIPTDPSVFETLGFLIAGLLWALVVLPVNNMRIERGLGFGLLAIYLCFLFLKLATAIGLITTI